MGPSHHSILFPDASPASRWHKDKQQPFLFATGTCGHMTAVNSLWQLNVKVLKGIDSDWDQGTGIKGLPLLPISISWHKMNVKCFMLGKWWWVEPFLSLHWSPDQNQVPSILLNCIPTGNSPLPSSASPHWDHMLNVTPGRALIASHLHSTKKPLLRAFFTSYGEL